MSPSAAQARVLVADDEPAARELLAEHLTAAGFAVECVEDGQAALDRLQGDGPPVDVVLLDWMMPRMDGLAALKAIKASPRLQILPVIMQTARTDPGDVIESVRAGAYYYVTKPFEPAMVLSMVRTAAEDHQRYRAVHRRLSEGLSALRNLRDGRFEFRTDQEAAALANVLSQACPDPEATGVGLGELLLNAVEHGNLGISYDEKSRLLATGSWKGEVDRRLELPENRDKVVEVRFLRLASEIRITITDQGQGFDWRRYLTVTPDRIFDTHGRGIAVANQMSFDRLEYRAPGNQVTAVVLGAEP